MLQGPYVDADGLHQSFHSGGDANVSGYRNPTVDEALDDIRRTTDAEEQVRLLRMVQEELARDVPVIPLVQDLSANVYDDGIRVASPSPAVSGSSS